MTIGTLKSANPRNRNSISVIKSKFLSVSSMNTLLTILKVTDARRDVILAGGLYHRFPWRHLPPLPCFQVLLQGNHSLPPSLKKSLHERCRPFDVDGNKFPKTHKMKCPRCKDGFLEEDQELLCKCSKCRQRFAFLTTHPLQRLKTTTNRLLTSVSKKF